MFPMQCECAEESTNNKNPVAVKCVSTFYSTTVTVINFFFFIIIAAFVYTNSQSNGILPSKGVRRSSCVFFSATLIFRLYLSLFAINGFHFTRLRDCNRIVAVLSDFAV